MKYKINGNNLPTVEISLDDGESIFTESGGMAWLTGDIEMSTSTRGGIMKGLGRVLGGESLFLATYTSKGKGKITFASEFPGKIIPVELKAGQEIIIQKDAFLCAQEGVQVEMHLRKKIGTGLFGGEGFILQKVTGPGTVFLELDGDITELKLKPKEIVKVDTGHIAAYDPSVDYDVTMIKGFKNILFGGEGLFLATLTGPGTVWLQSMPIRKLARKLVRYMPLSTGGGGKRAGINFGDLLERGA